MTTIPTGIITIISVYILFILLSRSKIKNNLHFTDAIFTVSVPKMVRNIGIFGCVLSLLIMICITVFTNQLTELKSYVVFYGVMGLFIFLFLCMVYKTVRFKVEVKENEITVYPLFSEKYSFDFSEISSAVRQVKNTYRSTSERIIVKTSSGKKFTVESIEIAYERFKKRLWADVSHDRLNGFY